jgi:predicted AlkP superfamily phosphohydrolase/phosphomutase
MTLNKRNMSEKRIVIIGLDGMPYRLIKDLSENGTMPHMRTLIDEGIFRQMASSIPEISSVAWSSIITGKSPGGHGIYGFTELIPGTYNMTFPNFNSLKAPPFWEREKSGSSAIINVPSTYPARELNGVMISGFVALNLEKATYPPSLVSELESMDYRLDVDSEKAHKSMELFLKDLNQTLHARISAYRYLWDKEDWQTFMLVFTGTDRLSHFLWDAYEDEAHEHRSAFLEHLHQIDEIIGEIADRSGENTAMVLLSDHGFERLEKDVYVNFLLKQEKFLNFIKGSKELKDIGPVTKAFALDPARIYLNMENRYPWGSVNSKDREAVIADLEDLFGALRVDGKKVIKQIYRKEELFMGPFTDQAPDLVLLGNKGFNLKANTKAEQLYGKGFFTGKHSQPDAFLLVRGNFSKEIVPERPHVSDVVGIIDRLRKES